MRDSVGATVSCVRDVGHVLTVRLTITFLRRITRSNFAVFGLQSGMDLSSAGDDRKMWSSLYNSKSPGIPLRQAKWE